MSEQASPQASVDDLQHAPTHSLIAVLRIKEFRNLWLGLGLSSLGDWIGLLALTAMANQMAGDSYASKNFAIAGVLFLRVLPALIMGPVAGYIADRLDRRWTLIVGDYIRAALFLTIPLVGTLWWVFVCTVLIEMVSLVWGPAKDATIPNLVPRHRLEAANQISLATTYGSALPAAALFTGLTLVNKFYANAFGWFDHGIIDLALYFNAASFFVSGVIISRMKKIPRGAAISGDQAGTAISVVIEGWKYVAHTPLVRGLVIGIIGAFAAGGVVIGLARTYVADLGGGEPGYGLLNFWGNIVAFVPVGALALLSLRGGRRWLWLMVLVGGTLGSVALETAQYFVGRSADIDDVVLNTVGVGLGIALGAGIRSAAQRTSPRSRSEIGPSP